jgi:elongation of very long chain fatty acids protein 6
MYYAITHVTRLPNSLRAFITTLQIVQMVVGTYITYMGSQCTNYTDGQRRNNYFATAMYFSFFILFAMFFYDQYCTSKREKVRVEDQTQNQEQLKQKLQ